MLAVIIEGRKGRAMLLEKLLVIAEQKGFEIPRKDNKLDFTSVEIITGCTPKYNGNVLLLRKERKTSVIYPALENEKRLYRIAYCTVTSKE